MIHLRAKNFNGDTIIDSFPKEFLISEENKKTNKHRYFSDITKFGTLEVLIIDEDRIASSNRVFNPFIASLKMAIEFIIENTSHRAKDMADDYLHNIAKIHGNQKSIVERCIYGADGQDSYDDFVNAVKEKIQKNPNEFAEDLCALSKEVRLIDYHIGGYNLLSDASSRISITNNHNLKKFLLGLAHLFFDSFKKNDVVLSLHEVDKNFKCSFEYETFNIAMHSFLENISKYSKPYEPVSVYTRNESGELVFEMESVRIDKDETERLFERGISGRHVPDYLRGKGIGMHQVKTALNRSNISITIHSDLSSVSKVGDINYVKNTFIFRFPNYSI